MPRPSEKDSCLGDINLSLREDGPDRRPLNFTVDYEDTMKTWDLSEKVTIGNLEVKKIQISPVSAVVEFDTLSDEEVEFEDISPELKDGNQVNWNAMSQNSQEDGVKSLRVLWKSVVDLDEIEAIVVNGTSIPL